MDALLSFTLDNLSSILKSELKLVVGATKEIKQLSATFTAIQAVLSDAERRQVNELSIRDWLEKLRDVAYQVDDVLDQWKTAALRSQISTTKNKVYPFFSPHFHSNQLMLRLNVGKKIKEIRKNLDVIAAERTNYRFLEDREIETRERQTSSLIDETEIFGRKKDKETIVSMLVSESQRGQEGMGISVISVVGMGGIGKTTLVQQAYNDERVKTQFQMRIWVYVAEVFDPQRLTRTIIEDVTGDTCSPLQLNSLHRQLTELLDGKRFLLVLDDVWNEDHAKWDMLKLPLNFNSAEGSKIVVTTRVEKVADVMGTTYMHRLEAMPENDCWSLFSLRAFSGRAKEECLELEKIGKEIVKKCKGVPLTAKTVGSVMRFKKTKGEWQRVLESEIWDLPEVGKGIYPALLLSYYNLASNLKQCFAYCSVLPKDYEIEKEMLIKLWIAQGFVRAEGEKEMEEIGGEYFDNLLGHSLLHAVEKVDDIVVKCKMHDIIHDLAQFVTTGEYSTTVPGMLEKSLIKARHFLLLDNSDLELDLTPLYNSENLRTLLIHTRSMNCKIPHPLFHHLRCLRALDLSHTNIIKLPSSVEKLEHIRYLDLSHTNIEELPESVSSLCTLQTLRLNQCARLLKLPKGIWKLISLRHLEIEGCNKLSYLPKKIDRLSSLRTLSMFIMRGGIGCKIGGLKNFNLLQGRLEIYDLESVASRVEANEAELKKKRSLRVLVLLCGEKTEDEWNQFGQAEVERVEEVFEGLQPHTNLKELSIENYFGYKLPSWLAGPSFANLVKVNLFFCNNCVQLPALGKLPSLKSLFIDGMRDLRCVGREFYGIDDGQVREVFSKLESLHFLSMPNWENWDLRVENGEMPSLRYLYLYNCPKLTTLPQLLPSSLRELHIIACGELHWTLFLPPLLDKLIVESHEGSLLRPLPNLPNLKYLEIRYCYNLLSLPDGLGELQLLESLKIPYCPELSSLPEELQQLTKLRELKITGCPNLQERCQKQGGEDWFKIAHIQTVWIDDRKL